MTGDVEASPVIKAAQILTAIVAMSERLRAQAINDANDREIPGGRAMVALAGAASTQEWAEQVECQEAHALADPARWQWPDLEHESEADDYAAALWALRYWSDDWRTQHDQELGERRATIGSEANFLRWALGWAWDNEPHWDDFLTDLKAVRRTMENILHDGKRDTPTRVLCDRHHCERRPRLIVVPGDAEQADRFKCPACKSWYDADEYERAYARQLKSEGAERYIPKADAALVLAAQGTPDRVVQAWLEAEGVDLVEGYCEVGSRRRFVWWPTLWRKHLMRVHERGMRRAEA